MNSRQENNSVNHITLSTIQRKKNQRRQLHNVINYTMSRKQRRQHQLHNAVNCTTLRKHVTGKTHHTLTTSSVTRIMNNVMKTLSL